MENSFLTALRCSGALSHSTIVMLTVRLKASGSTLMTLLQLPAQTAVGVAISVPNQINSSVSSIMHISIPLPRRESKSAMFC